MFTARSSSASSGSVYASRRLPASTGLPGERAGELREQVDRRASNFNVNGTRWSRGNFNYDAATNIGDFSLLAGNFNQALWAEGSRPAATATTTSSSISRGFFSDTTVIV